MLQEVTSPMTFHDVVHGPYELPPLVKAIVNTIHFRRLLEIKQLGCAYKVYNEVIHNRYEHCVGTYRLAVKFLEYLERNTENLVIPQFYKDCVVTAGLLHDVGHGPFSHFWERVGNFDHEKNSEPCIDRIFSLISVSLCGHLLGNGVELIKALITGDKNMLAVPIESKFEFIFEIIHNKHCEIDVDKWDYLKRDAYYVKHHLPTNVQVDLSFDEVFTDARVSEDGAHIQYKYEHFDKIYNLFKCRELFHVYIYQNPMTKVLESILLEAIRLAEEKNFKFYGKNLSSISSRDEEFLELTDERVCDFLREINDPDIRKMMNLFEENAIQELCFNNNREDINIPQYSTVYVEVERAGTKMPQERIQFYGDPNDKPRIDAEYGLYQKTHYFQPSQNSY